MKLIQILALATAMATMATAQNSSTNSQNSAAKPSPSGTPAPASKGGSNSAKPSATAAKKDSATAAKGTPSSKGATSTSKPAVTVQSGPTKAGSNGTTPAKTANTTAKTQAGPVTVKSTAPATAAKGATPANSKTSAADQHSVAVKKGSAEATHTGQPAGKTPAVIAVKPAQPTAAKKTTPAKKTTSATTATKTQGKPATPAAAPKVTQAGPVAKTEEKPKPVTRAWGARGRRDPFVSPIRERSVNGPLPNCTSGKRCLAIPELVLQGTVKDTTGKMMAVVANSSRKTYFLRENDQVFNGSVEKITSDSIIFREYVKDPLGRDTAREVVKKLVPTS